MRRAVWLLIGIAHGPALLGAWYGFFTGGFDPEKLAGCFGLTMAALFFGLKVRDVAFLRFRTDRRSCIALFMIVALLHVDAVRPTGDTTLVPQCTTLFATTWLVGNVPLVRRKVSGIWTHGRGLVKRRPAFTRSAGMVWLDAFRPHCWILIPDLSTPRGPPA